MHRDVCIELPAEAMEDGENLAAWVGKLHMSLYGARDAATNWQELVAFDGEDRIPKRCV